MTGRRAPLRVEGDAKLTRERMEGGVDDGVVRFSHEFLLKLQRRYIAERKGRGDRGVSQILYQRHDDRIIDDLRLSFE